MHPPNPPLDRLPDPWLFDSEALLRELDRCRETVLQIPITNPNATHFGIQLAVSALWNLSENLRYILHLHREGQRAFRRQHENLSVALSQPPPRRTSRARRAKSHASAEEQVARARTV
jgi:hypothetical protein